MEEKTDRDMDLATSMRADLGNYINYEMPLACLIDLIKSQLAELEEIESKRYEEYIMEQVNQAKADYCRSDI